MRAVQTNLFKILHGIVSYVCTYDPLTETKLMLKTVVYYNCIWREWFYSVI